MLRLRRSASGGGRSASVSNRSVVSVSSQSRSGSRSNPRTIGPRNFEDEFLVGNLKDESQPVLAKIERCYSRLKNPQFGYGGFCFGLLDPTSNIYVNSVMCPDVAARAAARGGEQAADIHQRSLDGLLAFLTRLFPYLPEVEAVRYLNTAEADPILASLLIIHCRGIEKSFRVDSDTTVATVEAALRCAAVAARHPDPQKLVLVWKLVSPDLKSLLRGLQSNTDQLLLRLDPGVPDPVLQLQESWELASSRLRRAKPQALPLARAARKRLLIATIHRFYLQALAMLPKDELCSRYHHSLLKAGHCYGPLDPVSNIIINTIWYDKAYPPSKQVSVQMISTRCLMRIVARSFYGLLSFMCTRYPDLSVDQNLQRLQEANADLRVADPTIGDMLQVTRRKGNLSFSGDLRQVTSFTAQAYEAIGRSTSQPSLLVAYNAAATSAGHPVPHKQQELLGLPDSVLMLQVNCTRMMRDNRLLSREIAESLANLLVPSFADELHQQSHPQPKKVDNATYAVFSRRCLQFWAQHKLVLRKVEIALAKFNIDKVHKYKLHFVCGVNELVSGPEYNTTLGYNPRNPFRYHHSHINFLATCEDPQSICAPATLFFAECGNYDPNESWCLPMNPLDQDTEHVRCIYCEAQGITIVHPAIHGFHGRDIEFEKVLRGECLFIGSNKNTYTNNRLYSNAPDQLDFLEDDYVYSDYVLDPDARTVGPEMLQFLFMK